MQLRRRRRRRRVTRSWRTEWRDATTKGGAVEETLARSHCSAQLREPPLVFAVIIKRPSRAPRVFAWRSSRARAGVDLAAVSLLATASCAPPAKSLFLFRWRRRRRWPNSILIVKIHSVRANKSGAGRADGGLAREGRGKSKRASDCASTCAQSAAVALLYHVI